MDGADLTVTDVVTERSAPGVTARVTGQTAAGDAQ